MSVVIQPGVHTSLRTGSGCLVLFALPFVGGGLVALWQGFRELQSPNPGENFWILFVVGGLFALVGLGLIAMTIYGRRQLATEDLLKQEHPDEPWLWNPEWKEGRIKGSGRGAMYTAWGFTAFWNAISFPSAFAARDDLLAGDRPEIYLILLFPAVGIGLLAWAIRATMGYRKFGSAYLQLATLPGAIGGRLSGRVETRMTRIPPEGCLASLSCFRTVKRGKNTSQITLWQDEFAIPSQRLGRGPNGVFIPVEFRMPADSEPTTVDGSRNPVTWRLTVSADLPGVDFESSFDVPVFATRDPTMETELEDPTVRAEVHPEAPVTSIWTERMGATGGKEFYFGAARNVTAALGITLFAIVWGGIWWVLIRSDAPAIFPIVWGLFELLMLWAVADAWTGTTRVTIDSAAVVVLHKTLGVGRAKRMACSDVAEVRVELATRGTQQAGTRANYKVELLSRDGKAISAASQVRGKPVAREFARRLEKAIGYGSGRSSRSASGRT